jgi:cyclophilin family peptidyl-prolyl cis-trans isomerase
VIDGFMVQGGGYTTDFKEKPTKPPIPIESESSKKAGLSNVPGTVSMARTGDPNSATAQFFINVANNARLDFRSADQAGYGYTVFGKVVDGMDVVNKVAKGPKGATGAVPPGINPADVPSTQVVIKGAKVIGG